MSAIFGYLGDTKINIDDRIKYFNIYSFDNVHDLNVMNCHMFCYHQEITEESVNEELPFYDSTSDVLLTADVILDNRVELIEKLSLQSSSSDSEIILASYKLWGKKCVKHLIGDFAFVIYDNREGELILFRDQLGKRTLYYCYDGEVFWFSTIMKPLMKSINKSYLRKFLGIRIVLDNVSKSETVYKDVYHVLPASILTFKNGEISEEVYWELRSKHKKMSDLERVESLKLVFDEAVKCRLRTKGEVGIMLSGGLDSNAVCSYAAPILAKQGKKLYSYTSVPSEKYSIETIPYKSTNESEHVSEMASIYPNIVTNFLPFDDVSPYEIISKLLEVLEQPYKFVVNSHWLYGISEKAKEDGCKILLDGQSGNLTISYSSVEKLFYHQLKRFQLLRFYKDFSTRSRKLRKRKLVLLLDFLKRLHQDKSKKVDRFINDFAKFDMNEAKETKNYLKEMTDSFLIKNDIKKIMLSNTDPVLLNHIAASETRFGLKNGLLRRDPTRDIRVLEACYDMPISVFNRDGDNRMLIHDMLKGRVPQNLLYSRVKGLQGGDFQHRLIDDWDEIMQRIRHDLLENEGLKEYFDTQKLLNYLDEYKQLSLSYDPTYKANIRNLLMVANVIEFIKEVDPNVNINHL